MINKKIVRFDSIKLEDSENDDSENIRPLKAYVCSKYYSFSDDEFEELIKSKTLLLSRLKKLKPIQIGPIKDFYDGTGIGSIKLNKSISILVLEGLSKYKFSVKSFDNVGFSIKNISSIYNKDDAFLLFQNIRNLDISIEFEIQKRIGDNSFLGLLKGTFRPGRIRAITFPAGRYMEPLKSYKEAREKEHLMKQLGAGWHVKIGNEEVFIENCRGMDVIADLLLTDSYPLERNGADEFGFDSAKKSVNAIINKISSEYSEEIGNTLRRIIKTEKGMIYCAKKLPWNETYHA